MNEPETQGTREDMGIWEHGDMETWGHGDMETYGG